MLAIGMAIIDDEDDKQTFDKLCREYKNMMLNIAFNILGNKQDAEDAVQDAFIRIAQNFKTIRRNISPETANQFSIIARNASIDIYRKNKQIETIPLNEEITGDCFSDFDVSEIHTALNELHQIDKDVLYLYYIYGCSAKITAHLLGCSESAVYKRLQRAKTKLRRILQK
jgi:RNA polymerase sigma-70 factor (ECF subfamily)